MTGLFASVSPTEEEVRATREGDEIVPRPDVVMDRGFTVAAPPESVWPWLVQLGKRRAGWYLPRTVERLVPPGRRALRQLDARWQRLAVGDVVPDYGGPHETFEVAAVEAPRVLVYRSRRRHTNVSWAMTLTPLDGQRTRVHLRLRLAPVRHRRIAELGGGLIDLLTIAGLAAGLRERVES